MDKKIKSFIEEQKNLTFCTSTQNEPYCASCFYAFIKEENFLVIKSDKNSKHIVNALINDSLAGTIIPDLSKIGVIKGIQFTGKFITPTGELLEKMKKAYYSRFPFALTMTAEIWGIEITGIKMTDNKLGFGKKLTWEKAPIKGNNAK